MESVVPFFSRIKHFPKEVLALLPRSLSNAVRNSSKEEFESESTLLCPLVQQQCPDLYSQHEHQVVRTRLAKYACHSLLVDHFHEYLNS
jgi:hypothetical protein